VDFHNKNKMKSLDKRRASHVIFILAILFSPFAHAEKPVFQAGFDLMRFDYAEYDANNVFLDGETGFLPGISLKLKLNSRPWFFEWHGQVHGNTIKYDGQTQSGIPVKTDSIAIITDSSIKLGLQLAEVHEPYIGLGHRYWYRNILNGYDINGSPVAGLLEHYYWYYAMLGYAANFRLSDQVSLGFDIRKNHMINAKMDVNFLGYKGYDYTQVNLGNRPGARIAFPLHIKMKQNTLIVTPYYEIIDIGKSNAVALYKNGGVAVRGCNTKDPLYPNDQCKIYEPRSETRNVGIELMWVW